VLFFFYRSFTGKLLFDFFEEGQVS
jgi:hypothetical protein